MHIHGVADAFAAAFGEVIFEDRRQYRRLFTKIHCVSGKHAGGVHHPRVAADARHGFLDAFERRQRHIELFANLRVLAGDQAGELGRAGTDCWQRDRTPDRQAVHQHHPAFAEHFLATDEVVQWNEHVLAGVRAVHERGAQWQVATSDFHTGGIGRDQRQTDTEIFLFTEQVIRVVGFECQTEQGGDWAEGDVALFPVQTQADDFFTLPLAFANDPGVGHRARVGTGQRSGEGEARDIVATGQARQVVIALFVSAVMQQQFGRAEGVRDHHGRGEVAAASGEFHCHLRVGIGREAFAAEFLGNDQGEEAVFLDVRPGLGRQIHRLADLPVADHRAEFFGRAIDEGLFFFAQLHLGIGE